jgi:hypothetical protein
VDPDFENPAHVWDYGAVQLQQPPMETVGGNYKGIGRKRSYNTTNKQCIKGKADKKAAMAETEFAGGAIDDVLSRTNKPANVVAEDVL